MSDQAKDSGRGSFATHLGFIFAAVGSAVGLGNIWKFPYITGEYGGGAFVLFYLLCIALVGLPLMYAELIIGRRGGKDVLGAMRDLTKQGGVLGSIISWVTGLMAVCSGFFILSFYSVVAGWAIHFLWLSGTGLNLGEGGGKAAFDGLAGSFGLSALWHTLFMIATVAIVQRGVHGGIERICRILMPALFGILALLLVYVAFTGGLGESLAFLFAFDASKLTTEAMLEALGHAFFTLSLGMGAMVTYGSYLKRETHVVRDGFVIAILDTLIALMAGAVIFAVVFSHDGEPAGGPGLVFQTLPDLFSDMPGGIVVAIAFFLLLIFAALSSAISLLEVVVAYFVDEWGLSRTKASIVMGGLIWLLGLACAMPNWKVFSLLDDATTRYMLPAGGLLIAIAAGWFVTKENRESGFEGLGSLSGPLRIGWTISIRFVTPILVIIVLASKTAIGRHLFGLE